MRVELRDIHKRFGSVHANRGIDLDLLPGEVHGLLGENGAGKSTLMKILAGFVPRTRGTIRIEGVAVDLAHPAEATRLGIGMLYQDPLDFPPLTVLENFSLGRGRDHDPEARREELLSLSRAFGFGLAPDHTVDKLTVGERQQLELLRLLAQGVGTLILDEPTTGISNLQKDILFRALRQLASEGKSIVLVSHKLEDIEALCDRVTVLRTGSVVGEKASPFDSRDLLGLMFGTPPSPPPRCRAEPGEPLLVFHDVSAAGGRSGLRECSVTLRTGELVGLAGVEGSGQGVFLRLAAGLRRPLRGEITFRGERLTRYRHRPGQTGSVTFLPAGRLEEGLITGLTVQEHFALNRDRMPFLIPWIEAHRAAESGIERFRIRGTPSTRAEALSGGNQQRLLLSLIPPDPSLLLLENPTRGLDLESARFVWGELQRYCHSGTTLLFSSAELDEILMVADRILVFYNGQIVLDTPAEMTDADILGTAIAGRTV